MNSWQKTLTHVYENYDPTYEKSEAQTDAWMSNLIVSLLSECPALKLDLEFVTAAVGWISQRKGRLLFPDYESKLIGDREFALKAATHDPSLLMEFKIAEAEHYSDICEIAIDLSWRRLTAIDESKCGCMLYLSDRALKGALKAAQARFAKRRQNKFIINSVTRSIIPIAIRAGMPSAVVAQWRADLERIRINPK